MLGPLVSNPWGDHYPDSPVDWMDIPLGPGQDAHTNRGHFQFTHEGDWMQGTDVQRSPGYESLPVQVRWPERPR
jgi:hypothetical protein